MEMLYSIFLQTPFWGKFGLISFVIGFIALGINYALMPKPKSKSPLFSDPVPHLSIFGIIGALGLGFSSLCYAYWAYADPQHLNNGIRWKDKMIMTLGGEYGWALFSGLLGSFMVFTGVRSAYELFFKTRKK